MMSIALILILQDHLGGVAWEGDAEAALERARAEGRTAVLYFTHPDSPESLRLGAGPLTDRRVIDAFGAVVPIAVDCSNRAASEPLLRRFGVDSVPAFAVVGADGARDVFCESDAASLTARIAGRRPAPLWPWTVAALVIAAGVLFKFASWIGWTA